MNKTKNKVLIFSDNHGDILTMNQIIEAEWPFDVLIHCGDAQCSLDFVLKHRAQFRLLAVSGNCDFRSAFPEERISQVGDHTILIVHGHHHYVNDDTDFLSAAGIRNYADIICFGHTHVPLIRKEKGVLLINPGSLTRSRRYDRRGTYAVLHTGGQEDEKVILKLTNGEIIDG